MGEQADGNLHGLWFAMQVPDAVQQHLGGKGAQGAGILRDDGDAGFEQGAERDVVESDVRDGLAVHHDQATGVVILEYAS